MLRQSLTICAVLSLSCALPACQDGSSDTSTTGGSAGSTTAPAGGSGGAGGAGGSGGAGATGGSGGATTSSATEVIDKAKDCVDSEDDLGVGLTSAFGRLDGTVLAVVKPTDTECFLPNDDHVVLQVLWNGEAYRMVINVQSSFGDPDVFYLVSDKVPAGVTWEEGWHPGVTLDYVNDLGLHSGAGVFTQYPMLELSDKIADEITLGQKVSVYAESDGYPSSAHNIHRNGGGHDGAIVIDPESDKPRALLFHFADQNF
jgi:hypothetical protein